jgi:transcriptional regulator with GAF, ATPase, and Fis domain
LTAELANDATPPAVTRTTEAGFDEIIGSSPALKFALERVKEVAPTHSTVLLLGETGTGKELIARALHRQGPRQTSALVSVNCAALPPTLIESELFGHERGAFTGAVAMRPGRFQLAHNGTLFLDEIGDLPLDLQSKLLRVCRRASSSGSDRRTRKRSTCGLSRRRTRTWRAPSPPESSATICITG